MRTQLAKLSVRTGTGSRAVASTHFGSTWDLVPAALHGVAHVLFLRTGDQVIGSHAKRDVTHVAHDASAIAAGQTTRGEQLTHPTDSADRLAAVCKLAVAVTPVISAKPENAATRGVVIAVISEGPEAALIG